MSQSELVDFLLKSVVLLHSRIQWWTAPSSQSLQPNASSSPSPWQTSNCLALLIPVLSAIYFSLPLIPASGPQSGLGHCGSLSTFIHSHLPLPFHLFAPIHTFESCLFLKQFDQLSSLFKICLSCSLCENGKLNMKTKPPRSYLFLISSKWLL